MKITIHFYVYAFSDENKIPESEIFENCRYEYQGNYFIVTTKWRHRIFSLKSIYQIDFEK